jgi:DNA polymerase III subunit delta'
MKLLLHEAAQPKVQSVIANPGGTVLLYGAKSVGKRTAAKEIARQLNCLGCQAEDCRSCRMLLGNNHPDVIGIEPDIKGKIGIDQVHQLQHALHYERYVPNGSRIVIINQAHLLTLPAQNALLKTLEEPPEGTTILLTCENIESLLSTVISRCRSVHLPQLSDEAIAAYITANHPDQASKAAAIALASRGAIGKAITYAQNKEALERHQGMSNLAERLIEEGVLFEKLSIAATMATSEQSSEYAAALMTACRGFARQGKYEAALGAVLRLQDRLSNNVNPRASFEALAVELA